MIPPAGHFGQYKTLHLLTREFWWTWVCADVAHYVASCEVCCRVKDIPAKPPGPLHPLLTPASPWDTLSLDFITDLPRSQGHTCILVMVDLFTKMAHFVPCPKPSTAPEIALPATRLSSTRAPDTLNFGPWPPIHFLVLASLAHQSRYPGTIIASVPSSNRWTDQVY